MDGALTASQAETGDIDVIHLLPQVSCGHLPRIRVSHPRPRSRANARGAEEGSDVGEAGRLAGIGFSLGHSLLPYPPKANTARASAPFHPVFDTPTPMR